MAQSKRSQRKIKQRWLIEGTLTLTTPTLLSNGDDDPSVDLPILTDPLTGCALLTGASLGGALRNYLATYLNDFKAVTHLFGVSRKDDSGSQSLPDGSRKDDSGSQSLLIVEDALADDQTRPQVELRDGVTIDEKTRTATDNMKFDLQLLAAGTRFKIGFELVLTEKLLKLSEDKIRQHLAIVLGGLQQKEIRLGMRKSRGFGECVASNWRVACYDLTQKDGLLDWLDHSDQSSAWKSGEDIFDLLGVPSDQIADLDQRKDFTMIADFNIATSILIRSGFEAAAGPDVTHLSSTRDGENVPVISGTSLGGVIRAQVGRIARTIDQSPNNRNAKQLLNNMFGAMDEDDKLSTRAGKVRVDESEIVLKDPESGEVYGRQLVQQRVAIDRFTGGALESALFAEQPVFGGKTQIRVKIARPEDAEIGLMLLLLKDLWTGFTPIGGEASVGRGRLAGQTAEMFHGASHWMLSAEENGVISIDGDSAELERYVRAIKPAIEKVGATEVVA